MDWGKCIICQKTKHESLQCPANSTRKDPGLGYSTFITAVKEFKEIGITVSQFLDETKHDIENVLLENKASWHKSCRDNYNSTKLERAKKKRKQADIEEEEKECDADGSETAQSSPIKSRRSLTPFDPKILQCFFCEKNDFASNLRLASTLELDKKVRECAILLNDSKLIAKLSTGDLIAIEAKYHPACLVKLYNRARPLKKQCADATDSSSVDLEELAFAELIGYIEECLEHEVPGVLTLSELVKFYQCKLEEVGAESGKTNATRLKERVLEAVPDLTAHPEGREVILASRHDIGGILTEAKRRDSDAWCLARAAHIVRKDILKVDNCFNGKFSPECQKNSIPASLLSLVGMLIKGPTTKIDPSNNQACVSVSQLIVFNSVARPRHRPETTGSTHHIRSRECPLPIYTALKIHGATRDRALIDAFYNLGLSISYDRFLTVSTETTNSIIDR